MSLAARIKADVSLVDLASRVVTWDMKKSKPRSGDWWAPCPFHSEKSSSFHVTVRAGHPDRFYCFGCQAKGSVIDFAKEWQGLDDRDAILWLARDARLDALTPEEKIRREAELEERKKQAEARDRADAERRLGYARRIWKDSAPAHGLLAEYLIGRGIDLDAIGGVPPSLRLHRNLPTRDGSGRIIWRGPTMVGFIGRDRLMGVHRTPIDGPARARLPDGGKVPKSWLGYTGGLFGQPVRLMPTGDVMLVGEGIETTLAALSAAMRAGIYASAEAALSLNALCGPEDPRGRGPDGPDGKPLPSPRPDLKRENPGWLPPKGGPRVVILPDPKKSNPDAARRNADRALAKLTALHVAGAELRPPAGHYAHDDDFADLAKKGELTWPL